MTANRDEFEAWVLSLPETPEETDDDFNLIWAFQVWSAAHRAGVLSGLREAEKMASFWRVPANVRLAAGEMTAQEMRTAQAVAGGIDRAIRARIAEIEGEAG